MISSDCYSSIPRVALVACRRNLRRVVHERVMLDAMIRELEVII